VDFDTIKAGLSSQLKGSTSDSFILNDSRTQTSSTEVATQNQKHVNFNKQSSFIAMNDPWKSTSHSNTAKVSDDVVLPSSSSTNPWAFTNAALSSSARGETENQVVLDPWSSSVKRDNVAAELPSTNPWASDVGNVDIVQSIAPANTANGLRTESAMSKELNLFDPLKAGQNEGADSAQRNQDSSDLFGNWDTAVRQMYQSPSYNSIQRHNNPWSRNQAASTGTFVTPSLI